MIIIIIIISSIIIIIIITYFEHLILLQYAKCWHRQKKIAKNDPKTTQKNVL